ncbi:pancreatic progenitor cell differentiation and proliferation factor B [Paramormyrops kingsleyae]|uniref:Pancreatic progenitor cell differentiation and proliferation factor b n=1 Tax=Paramormyrops kingsleyae TaxID=1676925 RepID=A0A3B3RN68_9TELE|nr:pancreatic progenitor cell differentiation and proliferation factor B-like [Paramormyrops kingsleyae]
MAAIPSSGSLVATHDYYRRRLGSTSSNSSCGSSEYMGEVIPHHPGLPKQDSGHWWSSFFFGKQNQPGTSTLTEAQQKVGTFSVTNGQVTCIAKEMATKRRPSDSGEPGKAEAGSPPPS